jgi:hypothetical protein
VNVALDRAAQQPVPGGIELDLVDPVAVAVVGVQDRDVALRAASVPERLNAAGDFAGLPCPRGTPVAALTLQGLLQRDVDIEQVDRLERRGLVQDLTGRVVDVGVNRDSHRLPQAPGAPAHPRQASSARLARRPRTGLAPSVLLAGLAGARRLLASPLAIFAEPDLEEHQADGQDRPQTDQREGQILAEPRRKHRGAHRAEHHEQRGGAEADDPRSPGHSTPPAVK